MRVFLLEHYDGVSESHSVEGVFESVAPALAMVSERWSKQYWNAPPTTKIIEFWLEEYWITEWEIGGWAPMVKHSISMVNGALVAQVRDNIKPDEGRSAFLCPECQAPFDPTKGLGELGRHSVVDGVAKDEHLGLRLNCPNRHTWDLPGKTMSDAMGARPELAPEYIRMTLADQALRKVGL